MDEATAKPDWLPRIEEVFERIKTADAREQREQLEFLRGAFGAEAEAKLWAMLVAKSAVAAVSLIQPKRIDRRDLKVRSEAVVEEPKPTPSPAQQSPKPELRLVPEPKSEPLVRFADEAPKANDEPPRLSPTAPYDTAKEYTRRNCFRDGSLATYFWQDQFWEWNGKYYEPLAGEIIRDRVYAFLDGSQKFAGSEVVRFRPTPKNVNDVLDTLKAGLVLPAECQPPIWLETGEAATDVLVFRNGLVNILTGEKLTLTPKLWTHSAVDYDYKPEAKCPQWERFLAEVFPDDQASQDCVEQQLGYGMTEETKFEKAALWVGPKRSGKGTIAFVQRKLVGDSAYVGLSFSTWIVNENSKECLIGKRVGVFPDVRFKPGKAYGASYDPGGITHNSAELLLAITGRDYITIGRKYQKHWHGQLRLKLILISNEVPNLNDTQGILPSRFIKVKFTQSFFGKEDVDLRKKLEGELSGIAARCMKAYRRLIADGKFIQPQSGLDLERKVLAESDPYTGFVNDLFVIDPAGMVNCSLAKHKFDDWCRVRGRFDVLRSTATLSLFTQRLKGLAGLEDLRTFRPHGGQRQYVGLRLKSKDERDPE